MKYLYLILLLSLFGCANCGNSVSDAPNIRIQPGEEYCQPMCDKFKNLDCKGYYEDIIDQNDGGKITCAEFCVYELHNSIPLNPQCLAETLKSCDQIETICK